jgi:predicted  nucleic acid-binding Zn-ribbon protein
MKALSLVTIDESPLERAERQLREASERVASQRALIAELRQATENAERYLHEFEKSLAQCEQTVTELRKPIAPIKNND